MLIIRELILVLASKTHSYYFAILKGSTTKYSNPKYPNQNTQTQNHNPKTPKIPKSKIPNTKMLNIPNYPKSQDIKDRNKHTN